MTKNATFKNDLTIMVGVNLICVFLLTTIITTVIFAFGGSVRPFILPAAVIVSTVVVFFFSKRNWKIVVCTLLICAIILCGAAFLSQCTYDYSRDGNTYHKGIVGALRYGWNPLKESFYTYAENSKFAFLKGEKATWFDAYPKASEIWGACVYSLSGKIESGKCFNIVAIAAVFLLSTALLRETNKLKDWQSIICSVFCALNPVVLSQVMLFYNDGFLWNMVFICFSALLYLTFYREGRYSEVCLFIIFATINIGFHIKFSGVIFFAALCIPFFAYWFFEFLKDRKDKEAGRLLLKRFLCLSMAVISGLMLTGATSYVTNTIRYHNPFYTMIGEGSTELVESMLPPLFVKMPKALRVFCSVFSRTSNDSWNSNMQSVKWKLPFLFTKDEVLSAQGCDTRISGWGILFSGILLISLAVIFCLLWKIRKTHPRVIAVATLLFITNVIAIFVVPGLSWARYYVALLYIPIAAMIFLFAFSNRYPAIQRYIFVSGLLAALLFINFVPNLEKIAEIIPVSRREKEALAVLKNESEYSPIEVSYVKVRLCGRLFDLYDENIRNIKFSVDMIPEEELDGTIFASYSLGYRWLDGIKASQTPEEFLQQAEKTEQIIGGQGNKGG